MSIPLGKPKIDSLRIIVPASRIKINPIHAEFMRKITTVNDDGEIISERVKTTYFDANAPYSSVWAMKKNEPYEGITQDVYKIGFSSKLCEEFYFHGITKNTIRRVYNNIIKEGCILELTFDDFLDSKVVDTDVCIDWYLDDTTCKEVVKIADNLTKITKDITNNPFKQKTNVGIEWGDRNKVGTAYATKQYLKYYAKMLELKYNKKRINGDLFYRTYIKDKVLNNTFIFSDGERYKPELNVYDEERLLRIETTIKNSAHWKIYNLEVITLRDLLNLDLSNHFELFNKPIRHYMTGFKKVHHSEELSFQDLSLLKLLEFYKMYQNLNTLFEAIPCVIEYLFAGKKDSKITTVQKSQYRKKLKELIQKIPKTFSNDYSQQTILELESKGVIPTL
jgi:hypothetical protein